MTRSRIKPLALASLVGITTAGLTRSALAEVKVQINNRPLYFSGQGPEMVGGRVLVPLRGIMEALGATVKFDGATQAVTATRGSSVMQLVIGNANASLDGRLVTLDVPAQIIRGSTMVPLRFVGEALGADVKWQGSTETVFITADGTATASNGNGTSTTGTGAVGNTSAGAPSITGFSVSNPTGGKYYRAGDRFTVTLTGTAGGTASFYIPGLVERVEMRETRPGVYEGGYTVPRENSAMSGANAIGRLTVNGKEQLIQSNASIAIDSTAPTITGFSPAAADRLVDRRPNISAVFNDGTGSGVERSGVSLNVDGRDVTSMATRGENLLVYSPREDLAPGKHRVILTVRDLAGNEAQKAWSFTVADAANVVKSFTVDAPPQPQPGDVLKFRLEGEPGAKSVLYSIGEKMLDQPMRETSPGVYTAEYTVRRGDEFGKEKVLARFETQSGERFTVESKTMVGTVAVAPAQPLITSPKAGKVEGDQITVSGVAANAKRVEITIDYSTQLLGILNNKGQLSATTLDVDKNGNYKSDALSLKLDLGGRNTEYTVTVVGIGEDGTRSLPQTVKLTR